MRSLADASRILGAVTDVDSFQPLLDELGFGRAFPVTDDHLEALALPDTIVTPNISRGIGSLRALIFKLKNGSETRSELGRVAQRLASASPQMLWILLATKGDEITISAFDVSRSRPQLAALVVSRNNIVDSDSETLCSLAAAVRDSDVLAHCRWIEILGRESVGRKFFRTLQRVVEGLSSSLYPAVATSDASAIALLYTSRLIFLSFLETKGWLDRDHAFLINRYADCMSAGGGYHRRVLSPLFFGTLNTSPRKRAQRARDFGRIPFLNGGLFSRSSLEAQLSNSVFSDEAIGDLFGDLLSRYRFTARENTTLWSQASIDPEMLGKAFESLMSSYERKSSGAFYTPQSLVAHVGERALAYGLASRSVLPAEVTAALSGEIPASERCAALLETMNEIRVLDPACGSGAFLVYVLEELSTLRVRLGDIRPLHIVRRGVLTRSIFGVDINPTAVWLCELRLWLSMAIEDPESDPLRVTPLPNLDRNIRVGNSLSGRSFAREIVEPSGRRLAAVRGRYSRATGPRKRSLGRALDAMERQYAVSGAARRMARLASERRELLEALRSRDLFGHRAHPTAESRARLTSLKEDLREARTEARQIVAGGALPFSFSTHFADVAAKGGFHVVVGNPPWVRIHNIGRRSRDALRRGFTVYRDSAWMAGTEAASAGRGFGSQVDAAALFIERSIDLLRPGGATSLIVPAKLWRSLAGGGVRALTMEETFIREVHDFTEAAPVFDAAVYPSVLVATKRCGTGDAYVPSTTTTTVHHRGKTTSWTTDQSRLPLDCSRGSPWLLLPDRVRNAFERMTEAGIPFSRSSVGRPLLGVKTGCNNAFLVFLLDEEIEDPSRVASNGSEALIETNMLRPLVRGESVTRWSVRQSGARIIWTHDACGQPLASLPTHAGRWLTGWRRDLTNRSDARGKARWWMLFRTESADSSMPRVVWPDIGRNPRAAVLPAGDPIVPLNSCYASRCSTLGDAYALTALLNSPLVAAWLAIVAEPARGGYRRYLGWTMSILPLPDRWSRAREILAPLTRRALSGNEPSPEELLEAAVDAYALTRPEVDPLLEWTM